MVAAKTTARTPSKTGKLMAPDADVDNCPKYHCIPPGLFAPEAEDAIGVIVESRCRFQGRSLSTLDGLQLKLDLCHHTLLQSTNGQWSVQCKFPVSKIRFYAASTSQIIRSATEFVTTCFKLKSEIKILL